MRKFFGVACCLLPFLFVAWLWSLSIGWAGVGECALAGLAACGLYCVCVAAPVLIGMWLLTRPEE